MSYSREKLAKIKARRKRLAGASQGNSVYDVEAMADVVAKAKSALAEYKSIKSSEIHSFLFHFDLLWEGCAYMPKDVSEAMNAIQKAVALNRGVLEGYMGNGSP